MSPTRFLACTNKTITEISHQGLYRGPLSFCQPPPLLWQEGESRRAAERRQNLLLGGECSRCCCFSCPYHCARCCLLPRSHPLPLRCIACLPSIIIIGAHTNLAHYYESHAPPPGHFPTPAILARPPSLQKFCQPSLALLYTVFQTSNQFS